jgi:hypothetical protein
MELNKMIVYLVVCWNTQEQWLIQRVEAYILPVVKMLEDGDGNALEAILPCII